MNENYESIPLVTEENKMQMMQLLVERVADYAIYMLSPDGIVSSWNGVVA
jgi:hypothetical protein